MDQLDLNWWPSWITITHRYVCQTEMLGDRLDRVQSCNIGPRYGNMMPDDLLDQVQMILEARQILRWNLWSKCQETHSPCACIAGKWILPWARRLQRTKYSNTSIWWQSLCNWKILLRQPIQDANETPEMTGQPDVGDFWSHLKPIFSKI